jgi:aminoglycoside phosphotransferase
MPKYGPHLSGIEEKVRGKISELGLVPKYVFDAKKHQERFYTAPCKNGKGDKVIFKMRTEDCEETKQYFRREIKINQLFTKCYEKTGKLSVPEFIEGDAQCIPEWMVYGFIEGYETGDFYNGLEENNIKKFSVESFMEGMKNMHRMSAFANGEINLHKEKYSDFKNAYEKYSEKLTPFFAAEEIQKAAEILKSYEKLLDEKTGVITHGDLHPGNLIITDEKGIAIIDWYYVHFNNVAFDIAYLFLEIADKDFQKKILARFVEELAENEAEFWQLFRLNVLRLVPWKINVFYDALYMRSPKKEYYYAKLTPKGLSKLEANLEAFGKALSGNEFL